LLHDRLFFFFSSRRRHTRSTRDWSSDVCSSDLVMYAIFKSGLDGEIAQIKNLRSAQRYLPDNIYTAIENFEKAEWTTALLGADVKARYVELKRTAADRCPRSLGTSVKAQEVQLHHEAYNQFLG